MNLDFTALETLQTKGPQKPILRPSDNEEGNTPAKEKKGLRNENKAPKTAYNSLNKEKQERAHMKEAYSYYQSNVKRSEELRREIAKGVNEGLDPETLFLKAIECIYRMTGDTAFYNHCKAGMKQDTGADIKQA